MVEHRDWHRKLCFYYNAFWAGCQSTLRAVTCVEYTSLIQYAISLPGAPRAAHMHRLQGCFWLPADPGLAASSTLGSLTITFRSGTLTYRLGIGTLLLASCIVGGLGYLGYALAPTWPVVVLSRLVAGVGIASINPGINTYFAANESAGRMNWLHACFGLGATIGPVVMSSLLSAGHSLRWGRVVVAVAYGLLAM